MSRTKRKNFYSLMSREKALKRLWDIDTTQKTKAMERNRWLNGYQMHVTAEVGYPSNRCPKGYDNRTSVPDGSRRWAKRGTAKMLRGHDRSMVALGLEDVLLAAEEQRELEAAVDWYDDQLMEPFEEPLDDFQEDTRDDTYLEDGGYLFILDDVHNAGSHYAFDKRHNDYVQLDPDLEEPHEADVDLRLELDSMLSLGDLLQDAINRKRAHD